MIQLPEVHPRTVRPTKRSPRAQIRVLGAEILEIMLYGCVTSSLRACHCNALPLAHHSFLIHCTGWRKNNHTDPPISDLDTLMKTVNESIEATMRRSRILFAGFVARMEDTRLLKCVIFGELVGGGGGLRGGGKIKCGQGVSWTISELSV